MSNTYTVPQLKWENAYEGEEDCTDKFWQAVCPFTGCLFEFYEEGGKFRQSEVGDEGDGEITYFFESFAAANRYFEGMSLCNQHVNAFK